MITALLLALQLGTPPLYDRVILGGRAVDPASNLEAVRSIGLQGGRADDHEAAARAARHGR